MALKSKKNIESQKSDYQTAVKAREDLLKNKGLENKSILKDSILKSLKAKVRQMDKRHLSICASEGRGKKVQESTEEAGI
jgi:hypothetical protein